MKVKVTSFCFETRYGPGLLPIEKKSYLLNYLKLHRAPDKHNPLGFFEMVYFITYKNI